MFDCYNDLVHECDLLSKEEIDNQTNEHEVQDQ